MNVLFIMSDEHDREIAGCYGKTIVTTPNEESSAVPMVMAGPGIAAGQRCATPVSLVDVYPTVVECVCETLNTHECALPGGNLITLAREQPADRIVFSELHDDGSMTGEFMVRQGNWKLVHYAGNPPQLFNLAADPFEEHDLSGRPETASVRSRLYDALYQIVDPEAVDRLAFVDQQARIERRGGVEVILSRPDFNFTPLPS